MSGDFLSQPEMSDPPIPLLACASIFPATAPTRERTASAAMRSAPRSGSTRPHLLKSCPSSTQVLPPTDTVASVKKFHRT